MLNKSIISNYLMLTVNVVIICFCLNIQPLSTKDLEKPEATTWNSDLKPWLYEDDVIKDGSSIMTLVTPYRALDAAIMPISLKFHIPQQPERFIRFVTLIVDENPSPVVGKFETFLKSGNADFSTRIRIDKYTYVRAIAETNDGNKYMVSNYVKAAGGCSAPSLADMDTMMARLGKMKLKFIETNDKNSLNKAKLIISHPNFSGLQFNQLTRTEIPAHFINKIEISQDDQKIMEVEADISMSEDPTILFNYNNSGGPISVVVTDTQGAIFKRDWNFKTILSKN